MNFFYRWETSNTVCRSFAIPQFLSKHGVTKHVAVSRLQKRFNDNFLFCLLGQKECVCDS